MRLIFLIIWLGVMTTGYTQNFQNKDEFKKRCEYLLKDGGVWEATNPKYNAAEEWSPSTFGYKFEPGYSENVLRIKINGKVKDKRYLYWDGYYYWDPLKNKICYRSVGTSGQIATGETINNEGDLLFEILLPDGKITYHLDTDETLSENEFKSQSFVFEDGKWNPNNKLIWKRVTEGNTGK
jgi:hypothetical protein